MVRKPSKPPQPSQLDNHLKSKAVVRKNRRRPKSSSVRKSKLPSTYDYARLQHPDSIRLLTLHPGEFTSPIRISLADVRSREEHAYEALSYTWATEDGNSRRSSQIRCGDARIWVTKNCELALRYLRKEDSTRVLWVDAICINQRDDKERGHQVGMMQYVYPKATEVLVWLGESSKDVGTLDPAVQFPDADSTPLSRLASEAVVEQEQKHGSLHSVKILQSLNQGLNPVSDIFLDYLHRMAAEIRRLKYAGQDPKTSPLYQELLSQIYETSFSSLSTDVLHRGFKDIVHRRWWSRIWVVQEVALAKSATLIFSKRAIKYDDFFEWYDLVSDDPTPQGRVVWNSLFASLDHFEAVSNARLEQSTPLTLLQSARYLSASDPRDIIFGLLGLSDKFKSLLPPPDYTRSIVQVFTDVAKRHLNKTKSLLILEEAITSTRLESGHPSWVPHWSHSPEIFIWKDRRKSASRKSEAIYKISSNDQELRAKGQVFDHVQRLPLASVKAYAPFRSNRELALEGWRMSCDVGFSLTEYPTGEPVEEALWRTLCWNVDNQSVPLSKKMEEVFREWYRILISTDTPENEQERRNQQSLFETHMNGTSPLCTTAKGFLAAVPYTTKVGDCIVVLAGGDLPFVLRPTGDHYRLVGPCYVHGIMGGEAFPENLDDLKWFCIR